MLDQKIIRGNFNQYRAVQPFSGRHELNQFTRIVAYNFKHLFTKAEKKVFDLMKDCTCDRKNKIFGVFYMGHQKALDFLKMSRATLYRVLKAFEEKYKFIKRVPTYSPKDKKPEGVIILFQHDDNMKPLPVSVVDNSQQPEPMQPADIVNETPNETPKMRHHTDEQTPCGSKDERPQNGGASMFYTSKLSKDIKDIKQSTEYIQDRYISKYVPNDFVNCNYIHSENINHFWGVFHNEWTKRSHLHFYEPEKVEIAMQCVQAYYYAYKKKQRTGEPIQSQGAMFCGITKNILDGYCQKYYRMQAQANRKHLHDWLQNEPNGPLFMPLEGKRWAQ